MQVTRVLRAANKAKDNLSGFNIRAYRQAAGQPRYDPWERAEAWRYSGIFSRWSRYKNALPGLGTASVAFAGYCTYEYFFLGDEHDHHSDEKHH